MLYAPYEYEEAELFKRSLEIALLSFRASKPLQHLEDPWLAGELRSSAAALCEAVGDGLRRRMGTGLAARARFSRALAQVARLESLWLIGASLGQIDQESLHRFRERLDGPLALLGQALAAGDEKA